MSDLPPIDAVRRAMLALGAGDVETFLGALAEDVEWRAVGILLPTGTWHGREGVREALLQHESRRGAVTRIVLREILARDSSVLLLGAVEVQESLRTTTMPISWIFELRGPSIVRVLGFTSDVTARSTWDKRA